MCNQKRNTNERVCYTVPQTLVLEKALKLDVGCLFFRDGFAKQQLQLRQCWSRIFGEHVPRKESAFGEFLLLAGNIPLR